MAALFWHSNERVRLHQICGDLFVAAATVLEIGSSFSLITNGHMANKFDPIDHRRAVLMGCMF